MKRLAFLLPLLLLLLPHAARSELFNVRVVTSCGATSPYSGPGNVPSAGTPYSLVVDTNGNLCTNSAGGTFSGAVFPSGGTSGGSNGIGATDTKAFSTTFSGAAISGWAAPASCTQPSGSGSLYYWQCLLNLANSAVIFPQNITPAACSGPTLTTGGTAQTLITASSTLHGFRIQNNDTTHNEDIWFSTVTTASVGGTSSFRLSTAPPAGSTVPGASYTSVAGEGVNTNVSWIAATTGHVLSCTTW